MQNLGRNHVKGNISSYVGRTLGGGFVFEHTTRAVSSMGKGYENSGLVPETHFVEVSPREIFDVYDRPQLWEKQLAKV
jgi:hypothetical protein